MQGRRDYSLDTWSHPLVAVCIDKESRTTGTARPAFKWAVNSLVRKGQSIVLVHVNSKGTSSSGEATTDHRDMKDLFLPFRCFCIRKDVRRCKDVVLDGHGDDVAKSIVEFAAHAAVDELVLGAAGSRGGGWFNFKDDDDDDVIDKRGKDVASSARNVVVSNKLDIMAVVCVVFVSVACAAVGVSRHARRVGVQSAV